LPDIVVADDGEEIMDFTFELTADPAEEASSYIWKQLSGFNQQFVGPDQHTLLRVFARNVHGELIAGLLGETFWHWLYVNILWVHEDYRHAGLGRQLMARAEAEAKQRGCLHAYLDTMDFQAPEFYPKLGYVTWGTLEDFPPGHRRIFFKKDL
jgi:GNAT superfamily N-acetyltransferase